MQNSRRLSTLTRFKTVTTRLSLQVTTGVWSRSEASAPVHPIVDPHIEMSSPSLLQTDVERRHPIVFAAQILPDATEIAFYIFGQDAVLLSQGPTESERKSPTQFRARHPICSWIFESCM